MLREIGARASFKIAFNEDMKYRFYVLTQNLEKGYISTEQCLQLPFFWQYFDDLTFLQVFDIEKENIGRTNTKLYDEIFEACKYYQDKVFLRKDWSLKFDDRKNLSEYLSKQCIGQVDQKERARKREEDRERQREKEGGLSRKRHCDPGPSSSSAPKRPRQQTSLDDINTSNVSGSSGRRIPHQATYNVSQLLSLVQFIHIMYKHWGEAGPLDNLKIDLGDRPDVFMGRFATCFPKLISIVHVIASTKFGQTSFNKKFVPQALHLRT